MVSAIFFFNVMDGGQFKVLEEEDSSGVTVEVYSFTVEERVDSLGSIGILINKHK